MPITLTEIQQLSREVRALVAAGLPLEKNLADAGRGHGLKLQQLTEDVSRRLSSGEALEEIVGSARSGPSRVLTSAVSAGIRSGDLGTSIELAGDLAGDLDGLRRQVVQAVSYPLVIAVMAISAFLFAGRMFLGLVYDLLSDIGADVPQLAIWIHAADQKFPHWPWMIPMAGLLLFALWWLMTQSRSVAFAGPLRMLTWIPGVRGLTLDLQFYTVTRMIQMLVERQLPLTDALTLAGACTGDSALDRACREEARRLQLSLPAPPRSVWRRGQLPPLLAACLAQQGDSEHLLSERLNGLAGHYQRRIELGLSWMQHVVPGALLLIIGGGAVLFYSLSIIWPVTELYDSLGTY